MVTCRLTLVGLSLICLAWPGAAGAQQIHRWVDAQGNVHYSQQPPPAAAPPVAAEPASPAPAAPPAPAGSATKSPAAVAPPAAATPPIARPTPPPVRAGRQPPMSLPSEPLARAKALIDAWKGDGALLREAAETLRPVLDADAKNARALTQLARVVYKAGYYSGEDYDPAALDRASRLIAQALANDPALPEAHVTHGYILLFQKDLVGAEKAASQAARLRPGDAGTAVLRARIALTSGDHDLAVRHARAVPATANPSDRSEALYMLARAYTRQGKLADAEEAYVGIIRLEPDSPWARSNYAGFLTDRAKEHDRAIEVAQDALKLMDFGVAHRVVAKAAYRRGAQLAWTDKKWAEAAPYFELAVRHDPDYADAHYGLAMYCWRTGQERHDLSLIDRAGHHLQTALAKEPGHARAQKALDNLKARGWRPKN